MRFCSPQENIDWPKMQLIEIFSPKLNTFLFQHYRLDFFSISVRKGILQFVKGPRKKKILEFLSCIGKLISQKIQKNWLIVFFHDGRNLPNSQIINFFPKLTRILPSMSHSTLSHSTWMSHSFCKRFFTDNFLEFLSLKWELDGPKLPNFTSGWSFWHSS